MAFHRDIEGANDLPAQRRPERRPAADAWQVATGTLACPDCDAPVLPAAGGMAPSYAMSCAYCGHGAPVRDFLSLGEPTRPTRVAVRVRRLAVPQQVR